MEAPVKTSNPNEFYLLPLPLTLHMYYCAFHRYRVRVYSTGESKKKPQHPNFYSFKFRICPPSAVTGRYGLKPCNFNVGPYNTIREPSPVSHWLLQPFSQTILSGCLWNYYYCFQCCKFSFATHTDGSFKLYIYWTYIKPQRGGTL